MPLLTLALAGIVWLWTAFVYFLELTSLSHIRTYKRNLQEPDPRFQPKVSLIVPLKGRDDGLEENLRKILDQSLPPREVFFVVDSFRDPAYPLVKKLTKNKKNIFILTSKPLPASSGKCAALVTAAEKARGEILVFADSDIMPSRDWLKNLIQPLHDEETGVSTSYRWYFPLKGNVSSCLASSWNAKGFGVLFSQKYTFVWGGSCAIRRERFREWNILSEWKKAVSDDTILTAYCRRYKKPIHFVAQSVAPTFASFDWKSFVEWTNRQTAMVRYYDDRLWKLLTGALLLFNFIPLSGIIILFLGFPSHLFIIPGFLLLMYPFLSILREWLRMRFFEQILPEYRDYFKKWKGRVILTSILVNPLFLYNLLKAKKMTSITWRGKEYALYKQV